jgi:hypothetical protein
MSETSDESSLDIDGSRQPLPREAGVMLSAFKPAFDAETLRHRGHRPCLTWRYGRPIATDANKTA